MRLRPHHLLCCQGYEGMGYSEDFVANMDDVTRRLRDETEQEVELVLFTDDTCAHCPKMLAPGVCEDDDTVLDYDRKVMEAFGLEGGHHRYADLMRDIRNKVTPVVFEGICGECAWYPVSACREQILGIP